MEGKNIINYGDKEKRMLYDTTLAINKRVKSEAKLDNFFVWEGKTIRRLY